MQVWRKSSHSAGTSNCVEIAWRQGADDINVVVRDSKFPGQRPLVFTPGEWAVFLRRVKAGEYDILASSRLPGEPRAVLRPRAEPGTRPQPASGSPSGPAQALPVTGPGH